MNVATSASDSHISRIAVSCWRRALKPITMRVESGKTACAHEPGTSDRSIALFLWRAIASLTVTASTCESFCSAS